MGTSPGRWRTTWRLAYGAVLLAAGASCSTRPSSGPSSEPSPSPNAPVVAEIVDGDTIRIDFGNQTHTARLLGIDTPETVHPNRPVQCYGAEASAALAQIIPVGTPLRIERDVEARDHYDRLLLYVFRRDDDLFTNRWLLENGFADVSFYEPNTAYEQSFSLARRQARATHAGLWGSCDGPDQPIDDPTPLSIGD